MAAGPKYFDIISGKDREWSAALARIALHVASIPYGLVTELRHLGYERGILPVQSVTAPVLSIGNLTTGGTGKTPTVAWLVNWLSEKGYAPAIVSRGYGSIDGQENDEKRLLDDLCRAVPHLQNPRRINAARQLMTSTRTNVIVLDDGFQHRQLHRDIDFVLIDALNPWGYGALLPRGLLRERIRRLSRADAIFITRCELAAREQVDAILKRIQRLTSAPVLRTAFEPVHFVNSIGKTLSLEQVTTQKAFAFCGIGNPDGFRRTLEQMAFSHTTQDTASSSQKSSNETPLEPGEGAVFVPYLPSHCFLEFPDHHHYTESDEQRITRKAQAQSTEILLTTRKDLVKIRKERIDDLPLWALEIGLKFLDDPAPLTGMLRTVLSKTEVHSS